MKKTLALFIFPTLIFSSNYLNEYKDKVEKEKYFSKFLLAIKSNNNNFAKSFFENSEKEIKLNKYDVPVENYEKNIKINVNAKDENGNTPIIMAVEGDNLEMLKYLIQKGAKLDIEHPILKKTVLITAIHYNSNNVAEYLIDNYKNMINQGATQDGWLPIQEAALQENEKILIKLLQNGAKINKKDKNNSNVYDLATRHGKGKIVKILKDFEQKKGGI